MKSLKRNFALVKSRGVKPYTPAKWAFGSIMPPLAWAQIPKKKKKKEREKLVDVLILLI